MFVSLLCFVSLFSFLFSVSVPAVIALCDLLLFIMLNPNPVDLCKSSLLPHQVSADKQQVSARISLFHITSHSPFGTWNSIVYANYMLDKLYNAPKTDIVCPNYDLYNVDK